MNGTHDAKVQELANAFLRRSNDEWDGMLFDSCQKFHLLANTLYYFSAPLGIRIVERQLAAGWISAVNMGLSPIADHCSRIDEVVDDDALSCTTCCTPRLSMSELDHSA